MAVDPVTKGRGDVAGSLPLPAGEQSAGRHAAQPSRTVSPEQVRPAVARLLQTLAPMVTAYAQFDISQSGVVQVSIINQETGEVIRKIPPDELVRLAESPDLNPGFLVHRKV